MSMPTLVSDIVDRLHQPEYTGENRCPPCTLVNLTLGAIGSGIIATRNRRAGLVSLGTSLGLIYLRGYLVPGTPTLTKRYLPDHILRHFDKAPTQHDRNTPPTEPDTHEELAMEPGTPTDLEAILTQSEVLEPCEKRDDVCLTPQFRTTWQAELEAIRDDPAQQRRRLAEMWELSVDDVDTTETPTGITVAENDTVVTSYRSRASLLADITADTALSTHISHWAALSPRQRSQFLKSLRVFLTECPVCEGPLTEDIETQESCCRSTSIVTLACTDCGANLLEINSNAVGEDIVN